MPPSPFRLLVWTRSDLAVVQPVGTLDLSTHRRLVDGLLKVAVEEPRGLVVHLGRLRIPARVSLLAFQSVWHRVAEWPGIPIALVEPVPARLAELEAGPLGRLMPVCATVFEAVCACLEPPPVRRRQVRLPCQDVSPLRARLFVTEACLCWHVPTVLGPALLVTEELVHTTIRAGGPELRLRIRLAGAQLTLAVRDRVADSSVAADAEVLGSLARAHGHYPAAGGTVRWAVLAVT